MDIISVLASTVIFLFSEGAQAPLGTAFIVGHPVPGDPATVVPLVVTARQVIGGRSKIVGRFTPKDGSQPTSVTYDLDGLKRAGDVWEHPTDDGVDIVVFRLVSRKCR